MSTNETQHGAAYTPPATTPYEGNPQDVHIAETGFIPRAELRKLVWQIARSVYVDSKPRMTFSAADVLHVAAEELLISYFEDCTKRASKAGRDAISLLDAQLTGRDYATFPRLDFPRLGDQLNSLCLELRDSEDSSDQRIA